MRYIYKNAQFRTLTAIYGIYLADIIYRECVEIMMAGLQREPVILVYVLSAAYICGAMNILDILR